MIYLFIANGTEEIEALTPLDILRRAKVDITSVAVSEDGSKTVRCAHGTIVTCDISIDDFDPSSSSDGVILPGGMPGTENLFANEKVKAATVRAFSEEKLTSAICAAPSILGRLGLLSNKKATCFPGFEDKLTGAILSKDGVVLDGNIITAKSMGYAKEFALEIVRHLCGDEITKSVNLSIHGEV